MLTLDTSGVLAAADKRDGFHQEVVATLAGDASTVIPAAILAETTYMLRRRLGQVAERAFLDGVVAGQPVAEPETEFARVLALMEKYDDLALSFADAAVVACAERHGGTILTLDRRDFEIVARGEGTITLAP